MKYLILGFPHCGTCSLEKYLVDKGHEVVRMEGGYEQRSPEQVVQLYPHHQIMLIVREGKNYDYDGVIKKFEDLNPIIIQLEVISKELDFPWENKGDCLSKAGIRPTYKRKEDE